MKLKSIIEEENICTIVRNNPNTSGLHKKIVKGEEDSKKRDYSNIVLFSLMYKRGFYNKDFDQMINDSKEFVSGYEKVDVKVL